MNGKLIGLLIRSNAVIVEALDESARLSDKDGTYNSDVFWNLRQEIVAMAEQAEAMTDEVTIQQQVQIAAEEGAKRAVTLFPHTPNYGRDAPNPMIPISPAHQPEPERERLVWGEVEVNRKFIGKSVHNKQPYLAIITETDVNLNSADRAVNVRTKILAIDGNEVTPFDRPIIAGQFKEEFVRWIE